MISCDAEVDSLRLLVAKDEGIFLLISRNKGNGVSREISYFTESV